MSDFHFDKYGAFFAFNDEQLQEWMKKFWIKSKDELIHLWYWLIAQKKNYLELKKALDE